VHCAHRMALAGIVERQLGTFIVDRGRFGHPGECRALESPFSRAGRHKRDYEKADDIVDERRAGDDGNPFGLGNCHGGDALGTATSSRAEAAKLLAHASEPEPSPAHMRPRREEGRARSSVNATTEDHEEWTRPATLLGGARVRGVSARELVSLNLFTLLFTHLVCFGLFWSFCATQVLDSKEHGGLPMHILLA
jgi:hypothetical protein